jgi:hypothetical protein
MSNVPNIVIFRLPLETAAEFAEDFPEGFGDAPPAFVQLSIVEGKLVPESSMIFTVGHGDSYRKLKTDQLVFAYLESELSTQICSFSVSDNDGNSTDVLSLGIGELNQMLPQFLHEIEHVVAEREAKSQVQH